MKHQYTLGLSAGFHDAAATLIRSDGEIIFAGHAERYSKKKNDADISTALLEELAGYPIDIIAYYERPWLKQLRNFVSGQGIDWSTVALRQVLRRHLGAIFDRWVGTTQSYGHHHSHAAAGYYTSGFDSAAVVVVDAIGEWDTVSIWSGHGAELKKLWGVRYPNSIGLFYSAITQWCGLKPNEEEYILMGMAAYGVPRYAEEMRETFFSEWNLPNFKLRHNLHRGCRWWVPRDPNATDKDIAASAQALVEDYLVAVASYARLLVGSSNLVFQGGVALNCVANTLIANSGAFKNMWVMPNPGDAGSAIGCVAAYTKTHLKWTTPFLGTNIDRELDIDSIVKELLAGRVVAVANGRAEFGPRALGNRSLLCDPRGPNAKDRMNEIKKRQKFRPFAPAVLAEHADTYFEMPDIVPSSPYMSYVVRCRTPDLIPGVVHVDRTSRVQTVSAEDNPQFRKLLEAWYAASGCPILMNTSLNIKGEPLVNTWADAERFQKRHNIKIF
jgi:carbamoyltransferase